MSRTHDVTISAFDLDRLESELRAWREVAGDLHAALTSAPPSGYSHSAIRTAALEAYARLKTSTLHAPDSPLPYEL